MDGRCRFTGARSIAEIFLRRRLNVTAAAHGVCEHLRRRGVEKRRRRGYCFLFHPSDAVDSNANDFVITSTEIARLAKLLYAVAPHHDDDTLAACWRNPEEVLRSRIWPLTGHRIHTRARNRGGDGARDALERGGPHRPVTKRLVGEDTV
jgi:hypothetical protein